MSNEKFKVKFGLAVGDTVATVDGTTGNIVTAGDLAVNGGDITTTATGTANLFNSSVIDTVNIGNSVTTEVNIGGFSTGQVQIKPTSIVGAQATQNVFNTIATTVNAFGAATTVSIGANTGTTTINNSLVADDISVATVDTTNLEVTNIKAKDGTAAATIADTTGIITVSTQLNVDNININGNTISSTDTNGNITIAPDGTGDVLLTADTVQLGDNSQPATLTTNGTGNLVINTNNGTNAGSITLANGTNGNITFAPNGTGNVAVTLSNGGNLTNIRNYVFGAIRDATTAGNGNVYALQSTISPTRGISLSNSDAPASYRPGILIRDYSNASGTAPRSWIVFENARGTVASPSAIQNNDKFCEIMAQGYNGTNWSGDQVLGTPFLFRASATEAWASSPARAGTKLEVICQPAGVTYTASTPMNIIDHSPTSATYRADSFNIGTRTAPAGGAAQIMFNVANDGSNHIAASVIQARATSGSEFALTNFTTQRSTDGVNYTPTQSGDIIGQFKFNGNANTSTSPGVPSGPGGQIQATATENWSSTANGTKVDFFAIKTGTILSYNVISARPDAINLNANQLNLNVDAGTTPLVGNNIVYNRVYGQWQYDATLTPAAANTAYAVPFQGANAVTDFANIASAASTSRIIPGAAGMYKLQFSAQVENSDNGQDHEITFWWRQNGSDIGNSAGYMTVPKAGAANGALIVGWDNMIQSSNTTDYYELMYAVSDTAITLPFVAASAPRPGAAAVFLTLVPVGA